MKKTIYIKELNEKVQNAIYEELCCTLCDDDDIEEAMNSRLCDLESVIDIEKYLYNFVVVSTIKTSYSVETYHFMVEKELKYDFEIEGATIEFLAEQCFCDDFEVVEGNCYFVG